jgi:exonuclease VII small subunit
MIGSMLLHLQTCTTKLESAHVDLQSSATEFAEAQAQITRLTTQIQQLEQQIQQFQQRELLLHAQLGKLSRIVLAMLNLLIKLCCLGSQIFVCVASAAASSFFVSFRAEEQRSQEHIVLRNMQELKIQLEDLAEMHAAEVSETKAQVNFDGQFV